ncbi:MAG: hypothetical protein ACP5U2_04100 [Bryobacteraceae bacterium]
MRRGSFAWEFDAERLWLIVYPGLTSTLLAALASLIWQLFGQRLAARIGWQALEAGLATALLVVAYRFASGTRRPAGAGAPLLFPTGCQSRRLHACPTPEQPGRCA